MADLPPDVIEPGIVGPGGGLDRGAALRSVGLSLLINGLCPYLLYRYLAPHYPEGSLTPLVYASVFPIFGLVLGYVRTRALDFIALIALFEISFNVSAALLASSIHWALVARAMQGLLTASVFIASAAIGRPIVYYIARQFVTAGDPARMKVFAEVNALDGGRTFWIVTLAWGCGLIAVSAINTGLAFTLSPANYLLASQIVSLTMNIGLAIWSFRFTLARLQAFAPPAAAA